MTPPRAFTHDDDEPQPEQAPIERGLNAGEPATYRSSPHHLVGDAAASLHRLVNAADQLLGPAAIEPIRRAADNLHGVAVTVADEALRITDERDRWERFVGDLRSVIERRDAEVDQARELAARLEEQAANNWGAHYTAALERRIQDLITDLPIPAPPGQPEGSYGEHRRQMYDTVVTRARDEAHAAIAAAAKAGAGKLQPTIGDTEPETAPDLVAASPQTWRRTF